MTGTVTVDVDLDAQNRSQWLSKLKSILRSPQPQERNEWEFCISKVPEYFRQPPEEYTPRAWRFGLHNRENLNTSGSEALKASFADAFGLVGDELDTFCDVVVDDPKSMLQCYGLQEEDTSWSPEVIKYLLALDALFLALVFDQNIGHLWTTEEFESDAIKDVVYVKRYASLRCIMSIDLCQFENQIPFRLIAKAYRYLRTLQPVENADYSDTEEYWQTRWRKLAVLSGRGGFMDLNCSRQVEYPFPLVHTEHILGLVYDAICGHEGVRRIGDYTQHRYIHIPSATKIRASGIKIKGLPQGPLCTMKYDPDRNCLLLPKLKIYDSTISFIRNMAKYEEQHLDGSCMFHDYIFIMIDLIKTPEDLDILVRKGAIENGNACRAFHNWLVVGQHQMQIPSSTEHNQMKSAINERCKFKRYKFWGEFRTLFCSRPWLALSTVAGFLVTVATLIQTYLALRDSNRSVAIFFR